MKVLPTIRTRFAPSPTGSLTLGGIRSALFCYLYAKKHGGEFILRIEDTDEKRFKPEAEKYIIDTLNWLGIIPDHGPTFGDGRFGPYRQSERNYRPYVDALIKSGHAYIAFDTEDELNTLRKSGEAAGRPFSYNHRSRMHLRNSLTMSSDDVAARITAGDAYVVRFKMPTNVNVAFTDLVRGTIVFNTSSLDDKVLFKSTGTPTYHLAVVVDDYLMKITHAFRGEEWLSSTPLHLLLYDALGWKAPEYAHLPLLLDADGKKMSKRNPPKLGCPIFPFSVEVKDEDGNSLGMSEGMHELGYDPEALFNYLCLLGWHPKDDREIMTKDELIKAFDIADVNNSNAKVDYRKAAHFNHTYLLARGAKSLISLLPENVFGYPDASLEKIAKAALERTSFAKDIPSVIAYLFNDVSLPIGDMKKPEEFPLFLDAVIAMIEGSDWDPDAFGVRLIELVDELKVNRGGALNNLRLCFTGGPSGPKLNEMMDMMGRDETLRRLRKAKGQLSAVHPL